MSIEYAVTWRLARVFRWVRSPIETAGNTLRGWRYRFRRWWTPPTPEQLAEEARRAESCRIAIAGLVGALEAGGSGPPLVQGSALVIEDLSVVMSNVFYCGICPIVFDPDAPRVPCPHKRRPPSLWQRAKWRFQGLPPVRVVLAAWEYYD